MRVSAFVPVVCLAASLVLTFLCLFAGWKTDFMQDYAIITLNTSRIGYDLSDYNGSSDLEASLDELPGPVSDEIQQSIDDGVSRIAQEIGLHDFYSTHILNLCEGFYTPDAVPSDTLSAGQIRKNVTRCSGTTAAYNYDPSARLREELDNGPSDLTLEDLGWSSDIGAGLKAFHLAQRAMFVLYCIAAGLIFVAFVLACTGTVLEGRLSASVNLLVDLLAFLAIGIASAITTTVAFQAVHLVNKYGTEVGVVATRGHKFLSITWAATALTLVASLVWCLNCIVGRRPRRGAKIG